MFRQQLKHESNHWEDLIPRPVLAIFVAFGVHSPMRLLPLSDFLENDFKLTFPQLIFQDQSANWVLSVEDNSNNRFGDIHLLPSLEYGDAVKLVHLQTESNEVQTLQFAPSSTLFDVGGLDGCNANPGYNYLKVNLYDSSWPFILHLR
jgi:hypothetical protein